MNDGKENEVIKFCRIFSTIGGLIIVGAVLYLNPANIIRHEKACMAVAQYRKDTGTAGVAKLRDGEISLTEEQEIAGETVGPWMNDAEAKIEVRQNGEVIVSAGKVSYPCSFKITIER